MNAPIIIPTLNRYEHLKRCIESLKRNKQACDTELYISVDYPPTEKYRMGYEKVKEYLKTDGVTGFKDVFIYYQEENLGPGENACFLRRQVYQKYDCFIFSEDDNEFSSNFLEYINKGLEIFREDKDILAICGYRNDKPWVFKQGNVAKVDLFHAWGYATWRDKIEECIDWICRDNFIALMKDSDFCKKLYKNRYKLFCNLVDALLANPSDCSSVYIDKKGDICEIDYTIAIYLAAYKKYVIIPRISKVRNWGYDGSGVNCGRINSMNPEKMHIDGENNFDYCIPIPFEMSDDNSKILIEKEYEKMLPRARFYMCIMKLFGIPIARKLNNALYLRKEIMRKQKYKIYKKEKRQYE